MNSSVCEVLEFVKENDVKFVRLGFCDPFGFQKNISIMADELSFAFENGVSFDAHAIKGFRDVMRSDLLLFPDPATFMVLPWRPGPGRVARFYCDIKNPDGSVFPHDGRYLLKRVIEGCEKMGYTCMIGAECEFYLFKIGEDGEPTGVTLDKGGYLDISPLDRGEDIRREICLTLEEMGIKPESSHHEQGPGQNEIDFKFGNALESADNLLTFKSVVKSVAARNGLFASFMPKPIPTAAGSGLHINLSLAQNGINIFKNVSEGHSNIVESFIAGILSKTAEITLFLNPLANSYERFGAFEAPKYLSWSHQNRSQLVRIPAAIGEKVRMELRSPDPSINPHLAFALILAAGLEGIEKGLILPPAVDADLYTAPESVISNLTLLPDSLDQAIHLARDSKFVHSVMGEEMLTKYLAIKETEAADFAAAEDKERFYKERYFNLI
ncbi:glutamine synthetase family protein [Dehalobacterium formicoaceticum]|uniref:Glutamine synthetase family protein n=1 Tax=Dehalobacterium formicoaceticum TaxID=51515 RepID=A0ABT1Y340_9FIRM|nr:glutamine synthetase family protein [Dehalobacterium formicoaceticum]MCR6545280.1 glutamine synthetase family protein [Dehalobacterium formicoaceticum]